MDDYIYELCKKASQKVHALAKVTPYMNISKRYILMKAFIRYCSLIWLLIWMCCTRTYNKKINRLHERCLRIIYPEKQSSFIELLENGNSVFIHHRNLTIEIYKIRNSVSPIFIESTKQNASSAQVSDCPSALSAWVSKCPLNAQVR